MIMETIEEKPVLTQMGILQTVRNYDYEKGIMILERKFNGKTVSTETFYID